MRRGSGHFPNPNKDHDAMAARRKKKGRKKAAGKKKARRKARR
jgi:hypothetical protein